MKKKRQFLTVVSVVLGLTITAVFMSPSLLMAEESFWSGGDITKYISPELAEELDALLAKVADEILMSFFMDPGVPEDAPTGVIVYERGKTWDGYTLLSIEAGHFDPETGITSGAVLIDMEGKIVKEWQVIAEPARLFPGGYVMGGWGVYEEFTGITQLVQLDWDGNKMWEWNGYDSSYPDAPYHSGFHHDYQREGNPVGYYVPGMDPKITGGKTLIMSHYIPPLEWTANITKHPLFDETLYEVDWEGNLTWEWYMWEHFDQLGFDEVAKEAIYEDYVGRIPDVGTDYAHANSATYLGPNKWHEQGDLRFHPDNIMIDCRTNGIAVIIARHDDPDGRWKEGDIVWKIGPDYSYAKPEYKLGQIIGMHQAHMIPRGLPGAGNILLFDNGGFGGFGSLMPGLKPTATNKLRDYSRVIEFNPITLDIVWEYKNTENRYDNGKLVEMKMFSVFNSGAQRLINGNTLICSGLNARVLEVTPEGKIVWDFMSPYGGGESSMSFMGSKSIYRAERIPYSYIPEELLNK